MGNSPANRPPMVGKTVGIVFLTTNRQAVSVADACRLAIVILSLWILGDVIFYTYMYGTPWTIGRILLHVCWLIGFEYASVWFMATSLLVRKVLARPTSKNRLFNKTPPQFHGPRVCVLGNGPSLIVGAPCGKLIDNFDEVVRFNNFQVGEEYAAFSGTKVTVHFSDGMLYPTYPEYYSPNACVVLSLFMDRLIVAGSYIIQRMAADLEITKGYRLLTNPETAWVPKEDIHNLSKNLGIAGMKHPTSGMLAIDWFVRNRPDKTVPIYIHGFDFFQSKQTHYYSKTEPLFERINDLLGVNFMHEPQKERALVHKLVEEGHVMWLTDFAKQQSVPRPPQEPNAVTESQEE